MARVHGTTSMPRSSGGADTWPESGEEVLTRSGAGSRLLSVAGGPSVRGVRAPNDDAAAAAVAVRPSLHPSWLQFPPSRPLSRRFTPSPPGANHTYVHHKRRQENTPHYDDGNKSRPTVTWRYTQGARALLCSGVRGVEVFRVSKLLPFPQSVSHIYFFFCPVPSQ